MKQRFLIIRFSSFGDIVQCLGVPKAFLHAFPEAEIHWAIRSDFKPLLQDHPHINKVWDYDRKTGLKGLWALIQQLKQAQFTHVYDAHNNIRSRLICFFIKPNYFIRRSKDRIKRILLFVFRKNLLPKPFVAQKSFLEPLLSWGVIPHIPPPPQFFIKPETFEKIKNLIPFSSYVALSPSAAWELKRWPVNYWKKLIELTSENFVILGGPEDSFCSELVLKGEEKRIVNLAGRLTLIESCSVVEKAKLLIANDTGLMHVADQLGIPLISLIGPTAFGYPASSRAKVLEVSLPCKPCSKDGRGRCRNATYKKCLRDISPERAVIAVQELLNA